jgi:DNA-binding transcriptional MerR regulator
MRSSAPCLGPSEAARQLGISVKALRLYEERGLLKPSRSLSGWRAYGIDDMARAREVATLRALGLSLTEVAEVMLKGDPGALSPALAAHEANLEDRVRRLLDQIARVRTLRAGLDTGLMPSVDDLAGAVKPAAPVVAFELPWPWGNERFELADVHPITFIVGPLFSGKTRLARAIAAGLPGGMFVGLDRLVDGATAEARMAADPALKARIEHALDWLAGEGAAVTQALVTLLAALETAEPRAFVVDMVEQGLDQASQEAVIAYLRRRGPEARSLFLLTRSSAILDLAAVGPGEAIILCPANHAPPSRVQPYPGAPGYEAVATCLGSPEVRARTEGVIEIRTQV